MWFFPVCIGVRFLLFCLSELAMVQGPDVVAVRLGIFRFSGDVRGGATFCRYNSIVFKSFIGSYLFAFHGLPSIDLATLLVSSLSFVSPHIENPKASRRPEGFISNPELKLLDQVSEAMNQAVVRGGKGFKDRVTMLPGSLKGLLGEHLNVGISIKHLP